jgi:serpin B
MHPDLPAVVQGNTSFALDLFATLRSAHPGNLFFSPDSLAPALAMTYAGARGQTRAQMAAVLHFDLPEDRLRPAFAALARTLTEEGQAGYRLHVANRLWGQEGCHFLREFLHLTREHYGVELALVDFLGDTEQARRAINAWVEGQTGGKVKELIGPRVLWPATVLVLTNAIYFRGTWASPFRRGATAEAPFAPSDRETVRVPMMYQRGRFLYRSAEGVQVLELPYAGHGLSMLVLLPEQRHGLADLERRLTPARLRQWGGLLQP